MTAPLFVADPPEAHPATETAVFEDDGFTAAVLDTRTLRVHRLNSAASAVWTLCDGNSAIDGIVAELAVLVGKHPQDLRTGVVEALALFHAEGLLVGSPEPVHEGGPTTSDATMARPPDP